jgi:hypothetical protein
VKKIVPVSDNEKVLYLVDEILNIQKTARLNKTKTYFFIDLDDSHYWQKEEIKEENVSEYEHEKQEEEIEIKETELIFFKARNSEKEVSEGNISFFFLPDGRKEFGLIYVTDPELNETYTVFINPHYTRPEIRKGEVNFQDIYY